MVHWVAFVVGHKFSAALPRVVENLVRGLRHEVHQGSVRADAARQLGELDIGPAHRIGTRVAVGLAPVAIRDHGLHAEGVGAVHLFAQSGEAAGHVAIVIELRAVVEAGARPKGPPDECVVSAEQALGASERIDETVFSGTRIEIGFIPGPEQPDGESPFRPGQVGVVIVIEPVLGRMHAVSSAHAISVSERAIASACADIEMQLVGAGLAAFERDHVAVVLRQPGVQQKHGGDLAAIACGHGHEHVVVELGAGAP